MLKDITLGQYYPGSSPVHKLDPRTKILLTLAYITLLFFVKNFTGFIGFAVFTLAVIYISGLPLGYVLKGLKPILFIIVFTGIINLFMTPGKIWVQIPYTPLVITYEGVRAAAQMTVRLIFLIMGTSILTLTTSPLSLTDGIEKLLSPLKKIGVPAHELAMMMSIAIRFIPTLLEETEKIMKAQTARGADFESGNLLQRAKALIPLLVPLFISAFRRADELAMAMECRCYNGGNHRTRMKEIHLRAADYVAALLTAAALALSVYVGMLPFLF